MMKNSFKYKYLIISFLIIIIVSFFFFNEYKEREKKAEREEKVVVLEELSELSEENNLFLNEKDEENNKRKVIIEEKDNDSSDDSDWKKEISLILSEDIPKEFALANNLPPHPGKLGEELVLGVDQNANGIMDDMERVIKYNFRKYPELRDLHLVGATETLKRVKNAIYGNYSPEVLEEINRNVNTYVACTTYYEKKYKQPSYISQLSKLEVYPNMKRWEYVNIIESRANQYEFEQIFGSLKVGLTSRDNKMPEYIEGSEELCQEFISSFNLN